MKQIYSYTDVKTEVENDIEVNFYFFKFPIQIGSKKMYKATINSDKLELDKEHMKSVRKNQWKPTDNYSLVSFEDKNITVFYK